MDFIPFKALKFLQLTNVPPDLIVSADALRNTLERLSWIDSGLTSIEDALLCDSVHKNQFEYRKWAVNDINLSKNCIKCVGKRYCRGCQSRADFTHSLIITQFDFDHWYLDRKVIMNMLQLTPKTNIDHWLLVNYYLAATEVSQRKKIELSK